VVVLAAGYFIGGSIGDWLFKRTPRGRLITATVGAVLGMVMLVVTLSVPMDNQGLFLLMLCVTALFIPFPSPNVISTVYDVTVPEVRSTALAIQYFIERGRGAGPADGGAMAVQSSLEQRHSDHLSRGPSVRCS
jgi:predicted MFS family arabinose efflux permease